MSFFPPDPELPEPDETHQVPPRWWSAPEDEVPALVALGRIIATTEHVALALTSAAVYSDGVELRIERRLRRWGLPMAEWNELCAVFMEHSYYGGADQAAGRLRFGLVLGDGEHVIADHTRFFGDSPLSEPVGHVLTRGGQGGGGGGDTFAASDTLWLWPLPPGGSIELVMQWPVFGIDERRIAIDADPLRELADQARPFWD